MRRINFNALNGRAPSVRIKALWGSIAATALLAATSTAWAAPELIIVNGAVMTMEADQPAASAVAIEGGVIVHVGAEAEALALADARTQVIDAGGRAVTPGFIDIHIHPRAQFDEMAPYGRLDLTPEAGVHTREDLFTKLRQKIAVTPAGQLIVGNRYQDDLIGGHPTAAELDAVAPHHPVILVHSSGHRRAVNTLALQAAGITDATPNPPGGAIERDASGKATGIILESVPGFQALYDSVPDPTEEEVLEAFRREFRLFLSHGLVGIGDAGASPDKLATYRTLLNDGLPVRINAMISSSHLDWAIANRNRDEWRVPGLTLNSIKAFHGNSLSGRTAWLYEPYAHDASYHGIAPRRSQEELNDLIRKVHDAGLQIGVHSNGDREIDMTLEAIAAAQAANPRPDPRHRIEHGSVTTPAILQRMLETRVALAPHSYVLNHGAKMEEFGEHRWDHMHPNRSALELGIPVGGTSDHSVSPPFVMQRIESMVTRRARSNGKVYGPNQRVTVEQAIGIWTLGSAYLQFEEKTHGSIKVGKRGDVVILSEDPRRVDPDAIEDVRIDYTIIGGKVAYRRAHDGLTEHYAF